MFSRTSCVTVCVITIASFFCCLMSSCNNAAKKLAIGQNISSPISLVANQDHFYVLNANSAGIYQTGSILVLDATKKVGAITTPRLGKVLFATATRLFAIFEKDVGESVSQLIVYDLKDPKVPVPLKQFEINGIPEGLTAYEDENESWVAVSCKDGKLYLGDLSDEDTNKWLFKHVRTFPGPIRKALYFDINQAESRHFLYAFVTDSGAPSLSDEVLVDSVTYTTGAEEEETPNDFPDEVEKEQKTLFTTKKTHKFQFVALDLSNKENSMSFKDLAEVPLELRWLYFDTADREADIEKNQHVYRTNIATVKPHPSDVNKFYLVHRGLSADTVDSFSYNVMEVEVSNMEASLTKDFFNFRQVYGKNLLSTKSTAAYIHNVLVFKNSNESIDLVINDFRDEANFTKNSLHGILLKSPVLSEGTPHLLSSKERDLAYYDIAALNGGSTLLSTLFYTNNLVFIQKEGKALKKGALID